MFSRHLEIDTVNSTTIMADVQCNIQHTERDADKPRSVSTQIDVSGVNDGYVCVCV